MRRLRKKLLTSFVIVSLIVCCIPFNLFASEIPTKEIYASKELCVIFERIVEENKVTVNIKSPDGAIVHTLNNYAGKTYLDGKVIYGNDYSNVNELDVNDLKAGLTSSSSIDWGPWQSNTVATIKTGGYSTAVITGLIALYVGWCPLGVISSIASTTAANYEELKIKIKIRYGSDNEYFHYQRYTYFYGDGALINIPGNPFYDTGKEPLK